MKRRSRESATIDLTSLIDVVFLLLIFFMVSTVFKKEDLALLLNLPKAEQGESKQDKEEEKLMVELTKDALAVNGQKKSLEEAETFFASNAGKKIPVHLRADKEVVYQRLVDVLTLLKKHNLQNLSLMTEK